MSQNQLQDIEKLEGSLWDAADNLRANSKLTAGEYCMPVLGIIFLRHATNRYHDALRDIHADQAAGKMPKRPLTAADFKKRRALMLPKEARYETLLALPKGANLGTALVDAMNAIERDFEPLLNQLPKEYTKFENNLLEDMLRVFDNEMIRTASGDVFGRINEYFLMKFAMQGAQDNGEFFTPPSIVQTIVNVIEPDHGVVFDPACGSCGMFVQTSHFIEHRGEHAAHCVTFFGQEFKTINLRLAKMNLAVHGLEGDIREANTFYEDVHTLFGKCDFVMANPPFNVDMVDAERIKGDRRLPFGLPGITKGNGKKNGNGQQNKPTVSNGNYLWISYFHSYLNPEGRAGFVMSSQASSAGHGEAEVRRKIIETGAVDAMISIRSNFFYTRTVPCELWFFDKGKPKDRRDQVLMLDARSIFRKVTRKIYDFSPEQLANLSAIVWLYRDQGERFLDLVKSYFASLCKESAAIPAVLSAFDDGTAVIIAKLVAFQKAIKGIQSLDSSQRQALNDAMTELTDVTTAFANDMATLLKDLVGYTKKHAHDLPATNKTQHTARKAFEPIAERIKGLIKQVELIHKLTVRATDAASTLTADEQAAAHLDRRDLSRLLKRLDELRLGWEEQVDGRAQRRLGVVEQLRAATYFEKQVIWLQDRFPEAALCDVPGLVKVVTTKDIEAADWSLTPGRYVGVASAEVDEDFDFEETIRDIHVELAGLNKEAVALAKTIAANFEELGV